MPLALVITTHTLSLVCSEVEGRDRLVKVDKQDELVHLAAQLGMYSVLMCVPQIILILPFAGTILGRTESISAKL